MLAPESISCSARWSNFVIKGGLCNAPSENLELITCSRENASIDGKKTQL